MVADINDPAAKETVSIIEARGRRSSGGAAPTLPIPSRSSDWFNPL